MKIEAGKTYLYKARVTINGVSKNVCYHAKVLEVEKDGIVIETLTGSLKVSADLLFPSELGGEKGVEDKMMNEKGNLYVTVDIKKTEEFANLTEKLGLLLEKIEMGNFEDDGHDLKNDVTYIGLIEYIRKCIEKK